jgi:dienelactone hydrolase
MPAEGRTPIISPWGYVALQVDSYSPRGPALNPDYAGSIIQAAVAFYPQSYPVYKPDTPLLILIGEQDKLCKPLSSQLLAKKYEEKGWKPAMVLVVYTDAGQGLSRQAPHGKVTLDRPARECEACRLG